MSDDLREEFWDRLEDTRAGMLATRGAPAVPMSHYSDDDGGMIWFITAKGTDLAQTSATPAEAQYIVCSTDESLYARIDGTLEAVTDRETLDDIWNGVAATWFEGGKEDPDVQLLRFTPHEAEVWATGGGLNFMYEIAKSKVTGEKPDLGMHGTLTFPAA